MKNPFLKRLMKEKTGDVLHTSAYGEAQNSGKIGSTSTQSFSERLRVNRERRRVKAYRDSKLVNDAFSNRSKFRDNGGTAGEVGSGSKGAESSLRGAGEVGRTGENGAVSRVGSIRGAGGINGVSGVNGAGGTGMTRPPERKNPGIFR
ncbi:hypothetical protein IIY24_02775 [Candidatus Saccharibacteria bacterium]|nr:hypothetical protein [Candidatus Saccharibacteria bacterium]